MPSLARLRPVRPRALLAAVAVAVTVSAASGTALAGRGQESIMQDDHVLYTQGPAAQARALDQMAELGVDTLHTLVTWRALVPNPDDARQARGFRADDPRAYPGDRWNPLDDVVRGARARGIQVLITPTGPAPRWAEACSESERRRHAAGVCRPSAARFGQFVEALARRYSGRYRDETGEGVLPAVRRWSFWNEPNLNAWLAPQAERARGRTVLRGAALYRALVHSATAGLRAGGHRGDQVLLGETAPIASGSRGTAPVSFYRALFCVDSRGRRLSGAAARAVACSPRRRFAVRGIAHHPYTRGAGEPLTKRQPAGQITIAYTGRLRAVVRQGERSGLVPRGTATRIFFTEFGVSSKPPGRRFSVPLDTQAEWINQADYMAYRDASVRSVAQYELEDDPSFDREVFQTGICFYNQPNPCYPKPAWDAYRIPLYVVARGSNLLVYGHARALQPGLSRTVEIQNRASGDRPWRTVRSITTSPTGHFLVTLATAPGTWRLAWTPRAGTTYFSREAVPRSR